MMKEMKTSTAKDTMLMTWLKNSKIFLEADTLGWKTICTLGYLFFIHPQITHHVSLKGILQEAITDIKLSWEEVEDINLNALYYYPYTATDEAITTDMIDNNQNESDEDDSKLISIPFELYQTDVGYGTSTNRVTMKAIRIKSNVEYGNLLNKLLLCMQVGNTFSQTWNTYPLARQLTSEQHPTCN